MSEILLIRVAHYAISKNQTINFVTIFYEKYTIILTF